MSIEISKMHQFVTVVRVGNFSRAAEELHLSQPALTRSIQALEHQLGVRLLQRKSGRAGIAVTPAGAVLAEQASDVLGRVQQLAAKVSGTQDLLPRTQVSIAMGPMLAAELLDYVLTEAQRELPDTIINVHVNVQEAMLTKLLAGELDFYIGLSAPERANVRVHSSFFGKLSIQFLVRPDHPLVGKRKVGINDLIQYPIGSAHSWGEPEHNLRDTVDPRLLQSSVRIDNYAILGQLTRHTDMIAVASSEATDGQLVALPVDASLAQRSSELYVFSLAALSLSPTSEAVLALLRMSFDLRHDSRHH